MKTRAYLGLLSFALFTGATFNLAKYAVGYFSAYSAAAWRFGLAAITLFIILIIKEKIQLDLLKRNGLMYVLLGIVGILGFNLFFFLGLQYTTPVNGALIMATNPLLTVIASKFILGSPITPRQTIGVSLSLVGVILVITHGSWHLVSTLSFSIGDLLIFLGNLCWALYGVLGRRFVRGGSSMQTTSYTMVVGALGLIAIAAFHPNPTPITDISMYSWGAIAFMAFFTTVLGYLFWNVGIQVLGTNQTAVFFNLVPVVTMVVSLISGIQVTWIQLVGAVIVISGVVVASNVDMMNRFVYNKMQVITCIKGGPIDEAQSQH